MHLSLNLFGIYCTNYFLSKAIRGRKTILQYSTTSSHLWLFMYTSFFSSMYCYPSLQSHLQAMHNDRPLPLSMYPSDRKMHSLQHIQKTLSICHFLKKKKPSTSIWQILCFLCMHYLFFFPCALCVCIHLFEVVFSFVCS